MCLLLLIFFLINESAKTESSCPLDFCVHKPAGPHFVVLGPLALAKEPRKGKLPSFSFQGAYLTPLRQSGQGSGPVHTARLPAGTPKPWCPRSSTHPPFCSSPWPSTLEKEREKTQATLVVSARKYQEPWGQQRYHRGSQPWRELRTTLGDSHARPHPSQSGKTLDR